MSQYQFVNKLKDKQQKTYKFIDGPLHGAFIATKGAKTWKYVPVGSYHDEEKMNSEAHHYSCRIISRNDKYEAVYVYDDIRNIGNGVLDLLNSRTK